jgi:Leucine-rich repeat (LRR) protein
MKKLYPLLSVLFLIYWGCDEEQPEEVDTTPPTVTVTFPQNNSSVFEIVSITCISSDNEGVEKVELWVNGVTTGLTDNSEPYSFDWNTTLLDNGNYTITIRSYDTSDNTTDSEPIVLTVDNNPQPINITSVIFDNGGFTITWNQSIDGDFSTYELEKSTDSTMNSPSVVFTTESLEQTTYFDTDVNPLIYQYYRVTVIDTFDYETKGEIMSTSLDPVPSSVNVESVEYDTTQMTISWSESSDGDFKDYKLLYSETESGDRDTLVTYTDISTTSYTITEFDPLVENWFWVQVTDTLGLSSLSNGYMVLDSPPTPSELYPISWDNGFQISWSQNNDNDFQSYKLYESLSDDMSDQTLLFETTDRTVITYLKTTQNIRYYQITSEDVWGLQSKSNIEVGDYYIELWGELYSVSNTTGLELNNNQLTGSIPPEIGNLTNLTYLSLSNNQLTGEIPSEIWNLTNLNHLWLQYNELTGEIPSEIGNLTNLNYLSLGGNQLTGEIPPEIGNLTNLTFLDLGYNQLTGSIPPEIGNLTNLNYLNLSNNQLTGSVPPEIGNLTNLTTLDLRDNQLTGSIPPEIGNLINLYFFILEFNQLTGSIPSEIGNLTNLTYLWLNDNQLTGLIPESICDLDINWSSSIRFNITNNQLCPPYPSCIEDDVGLQDVCSCGFDDDEVVYLWGNCYSIEYTTELDLSNSGLTGEIPSEIGNLTNLTKLYLNGNQLTGSIPSEIGNLTHLNFLYLHNNQLTGEIPESLCNLVENNCYISILNNQLCPPYPSCISQNNIDTQDTSDCD